MEAADLALEVTAAPAASETAIAEQLPLDTSDPLEPRVDARGLHRCLGVSRDFSTWLKERFEYTEAVDGVDFVVCSPNLGSKECGVERKGRGGHNTKDYLLSLDLAKQFAMLERNEKGRQARLYFIECEKRLRQQTMVPAIDFSDPLTAAKLYIEAEEGRRLALTRVETLTQENAELEVSVTVAETEAGGRGRKAVRPGRRAGLSVCLSGSQAQIASMCNTYRIIPKRGAKGLARRVNEAAAKLVSDLVRKSDPGVVMRTDGRVEVMRWGFHREFNPAVNNARSDKLESGMWKEAFQERRCVIPMSLFYEWGPGSGSRGGRKQAHEFHDPDDDFLWAAGIWEEHSELGPCYSMVTTSASPPMAPIHDRMPALLRPEGMAEFLAGGGHWDFQPFTGPLAVTPCESPLAKRRNDGAEQAELF